MVYTFQPLSFFFLMIRRPPRSTLFPYRRSSDLYRILSRTVSRKVLRATTRRLCISHLPVCLLKKNLFERSFVRDHRNESPPCLSNRHENFLYFVLSWDNHPATIPSLQQSNRSALDQRNFFTNKDRKSVV